MHNIINNEIKAKAAERQPRLYTAILHFPFYPVLYGMAPSHRATVVHTDVFGGGGEVVPADDDDSLLYAHTAAEKCQGLASRSPLRGRLFNCIIVKEW